MAEAFGSTSEAQEQAKKLAEEEAQQGAEEDDGWGRGLGILINNPVTNALLKPLEILDYPRRAVTLGIEELGEAIPDWDLPAPLEALTFLNPATLPAALLNRVGTGADEDDPRSNWDKLTDPTYGAGQIMEPIEVGPDWFETWANRAQGLAGDIALDPLTYISGGGARAIAGARKLNAGADVAQAGVRATAAERALAEAAQAGDFSRMGTLASEAADTSKRLTRAEEFLAEVPNRGEYQLPGGRQARAQQLGDLQARLSPEDIERLTPQIRRAGERGLGVATPELREAMGIAKPGYRIGTARIPGSQVPARALAEATGAVRAGFNRIPGAGRLPRGPKGLEQALSTLTRGGNELTIPEALADMSISSNYRLGEGAFRSRGRAQLRDLVRRDFGRAGLRRGALSNDQIRKLMTEAESSATPNVINNLFSKLAKTYTKITGQPLDDFLRDPDTYVPHMMTPGFKRMLRSKLDADDPLAAAFVKEGGFYTDSLLESSGFMNARAYAPDVKGTPKTFTIKDRDITLTDGSLGEINSELRKVFPTFKGDFYEMDPVRIAESYIDSMGRQVGTHRALEAQADLGGPFAHRVEGPLAEALAGRNKILAATPQAQIVEQVRQGYNKGQEPFEVTPRPQMPEEIAGVRLKDYFVSEAGKKASNAERSILRQQGQKYLKGARTDVAEARGEAGQVLGDLRNVLVEPLRSGVRDIDRVLKPVKQRIQTYRDDLKRLKPKRTADHLELQSTILSMRRDLSDLEDALRTQRRIWNGQETRARRKVASRLEGELREMRTVHDQAVELFRNGPARMVAEADARLARLQRPLKAAQGRLKAVLDAIPGKPSEGRLTNARKLLATSPDDTLDEVRDAVGKAVASVNAPLRQANGRMTKEGLAEASLRYANMVGDRRYEFQRLDSELAQVRKAIDNATPEELPGLRAQRDALLRQSRTKEMRDQRRAFDAVVEEMEFQHRYRQIETKSDEAKAVAAARRVASQEQESIVYSRREGGLVRRELDKRPEETYRSFEEGRTRVPVHPSQARKQDVSQLKRPRTEQAAIQNLRKVSESDIGAKDVQSAAENVTGAEAALAKFQESEVGQTSRYPEMAEVEAKRSAAMRPNLQAHRKTREELDDMLERERARLRMVDENITRTQYNLQQDMANKTKLEAKRAELEPLRAQLQPLRPKNQRSGLLETVDTIETVARQNPLLDDPSLASVESLLQSQRENLQKAEKIDINARDVAILTKKADDGSLAKVMLTTLNDNWKVMHKGLVQPGDVIVNAELFKRHQNLFELAKEPGMFGRTFNALTNLFKTYATLSPGFHVRNALSAIFMNTSDGVPLALQYQAAKRNGLWNQYMKGGEEWLAKQDPLLQEAFEVTFASGAGGRYTEAGVAEATGSPAYNALAANRVVRGGQRLGERVEGSVRLAMAMDSLQRGEDAASALQRITRVHFDYAQVSKMDESMKRLIPFWTFMSRNLPLQVTQMWTKPKTYAHYQSLVRNFSTAPEEYTPEYWSDQGAWNTGGTLGGLPMYMQPDLGFTRLEGDVKNIEDALSLEQPTAILSQFNPLLTAPAELLTKQDFYTGQRFGEEDYSDVGGPIGAGIKALATVTGQTNEIGQVSDNFYNFMRSWNPLLDRATRMLPGATGATGTGNQDRLLESYLRFLGMPVRQLSPTQQDNQYFSEVFEGRDEVSRQRAMQRALLERQAG